MEHFLANVCTPDWNRRQDAGRPFAEAEAEAAAAAALGIHPIHFTGPNQLRRELTALSLL
jgi:2-haloacid dehalogenase